MAKYGKTWWGQQWLKALNRIDFSNRLPRGRTYANKGAVLDFSIDGNFISSKVEGSRPQPYKQQMAVKPLTEAQKKVLIDAIVQDYGLVAELLNRKLPAQLMKLAEREGIQIFPRDWMEMEMECSCPDWAVPCKHLAAVVYMIGNEIDRNPFVALNMLGLDVVKELNARGFALDAEGAEPMLQLKDWPTGDADGTELPPLDRTKLDFSAPHRETAALLASLPDETLFADSDIKAWIRKAAKQSYKYAKELTMYERSEERVERLKAAEAVYLVTNASGRMLSLLQKTKQGTTGLFPADEGILTLIEIFQTLSPLELGDFAPDVQWLYWAWMNAYHQLQGGALLPKPIAADGGINTLWGGAELYGQFSPAAHHLAETCPPTLAVIELEEAKLLPPDERFLLVSHLFYSTLLDEMTLGGRSNAKDGKVSEYFFGLQDVRFDALGEAEIPNSLQLWLKGLSLGNQPFGVALTVQEHEAEGAFSLGIGVRTKGAETQELTYFPTVLKDTVWAKHKMPLLKLANTLTESIPVLGDLLQPGHKSETSRAIDGGEFESVFFEALPKLKALGVGIILPKSLRHLGKPSLSMSVSTSEAAKDGLGFFSLQAMLDFDWQIAVGDSQLSPDEFRALVQGKEGIVKFRNEYVHLDRKEIEALLRQLDKLPKVNPATLMQSVLSEQYKGTPIHISEEVRSMLAQLKETPMVATPNGLEAQLRPYQQTGFSWLWKNAQLGMGSIIADDMGLGKTLQVIAFLLKMKEEGGLAKQKALVIVPTSLLTNWQKEVARFAPTLKVEVYHGAKRALPEDFDMLLTSYGVARTDASKLTKARWQCVVIDEAQNIKNTNTKQTKAIKSFKAGIKVAMSGTPVENRLSEYWSLMDFTNTGFMGTLNNFVKEFATPIQKENDADKASAFRKIASPFLLRRLKSDKSIISDLPDKVEANRYTSLEKEQAALYEKIVEANIQRLDTQESADRRGLVLQMMMALKQVCNHPHQYLKKSAAASEDSGKGAMLMELLKEIHASDEKVLIFTQFKEMGAIISGWVEQRFGREPLFLHGGNSRKERDEMVDRFQNNPRDRVFILSLKAGGVGLNLTAASHVIHYDLWWNPAVEAQATDRAYRIGQKRNVMVHRLISTGTLEEKIDRMIQHKKSLADLTVATGEQWLGELSDNELKNLVRLSSDMQE